MKLHRYQHIFGPYNKYLRAEFLPHWLQYSLVYCYAVWEALKSRNILFFTATNPCCALGWIYPTSKKETLDQLPSYICPKSILIDHWQDPDHILKHIRNEGIDFPFVVKPNEWLRGMGIIICRTLWDRDRLIVQERYLTTHRQRWTRIVQELSEYRQEYGIFYVRLPGQSQGMISGIVQRDFPFIVGDGRSTIEKLVHHHPRARYYYPLFARQHHDIWQKILPEWEKLQLVEIGNHNRGTTFVDNSGLITLSLIQEIDAISKHINGFFYGRYDIKADSIEDIVAKRYSVLELNMTYSEPTWMYDPHYNFFQASRILLRHRRFIYQIASHNHHQGIPYATLQQFLHNKKHHEGHLE